MLVTPVSGKHQVLGAEQTCHPENSRSKLYGSNVFK